MRSIVRRSLGLRNFSRGYEAESIVLKEFLRRGFKLKKQRYKFFQQEVDLIFVDPQGGLALVEVKSVSDANFIDTVFSKAQRQKYRQLITRLREQNEVVYFYLAIVDARNRVSVIDSALEY